MARPRIKEDEVEGLLWEITQLFTPSTPIKLADLFAGRQQQISQMLDAVAEPGRHAILYGERGVGKTSLSQVLQHFVPAGRQKIIYLRKACSPDDNFTSIWKKFFRDMKFSVTTDDGQENHSVDELYPSQISPDDVLREMAYFSPNEIPIFVVDEFNEIDDVGTSALFANTIKMLSDDGIHATILIVGVGDNVSELFKEHGSISRCTEEVPMPRMSSDELGEIIDKRISQLGLTIERDARWKIIILSRGLPTYVHRLAKYALSRSVRDRRINTTEADVDAAIQEMLQGSLQSLREDYEKAIRSNQPGNLFKEVLLACALAKSDDAGWFLPSSVREPLIKLLGRSMQIAQYQNHLTGFISEDRAKILQRAGEERSYRFRFRDPAMLPYVLMKGIADDMIPEEATHLLHFPEQRDLFPSGS